MTRMILVITRTFHWGELFKSSIGSQTSQTSHFSSLLLYSCFLFLRNQPRRSSLRRNSKKSSSSACIARSCSSTITTDWTLNPAGADFQKERNITFKLNFSPNEVQHCAQQYCCTQMLFTLCLKKCSSLKFVSHLYNYLHFHLYWEESRILSYQFMLEQPEQ